MWSFWKKKPCPCGSGKAQKKCCDAKESKTPGLSINELCAEMDELDDLSNSVLNLIQEKRYDEAEKACRQLLSKYPDQVDGLERLAITYEAQGLKSQAAEYYRKSAEFMKTHEGFDREGIADMVQKAELMEKEGAAN